MLRRYMSDFTAFRRCPSVPETCFADPRGRLFAPNLLQLHVIRSETPYGQTVFGVLSQGLGGYVLRSKVWGESHVGGGIPEGSQAEGRRDPIAETALHRRRSAVPFSKPQLRGLIAIVREGAEASDKKRLDLTPQMTIICQSNETRGMGLMVSKVERERAALEAAEKELAERKKKLAELEQEEAEKQLARLVRKVGQDRAIQLLELAVKVKPKAAVDALTKLG